MTWGGGGEGKWRQEIISDAILACNFTSEWKIKRTSSVHKSVPADWTGGPAKKNSHATEKNKYESGVLHAITFFTNVFCHVALMVL